jgi:putative transposase
MRFRLQPTSAHEAALLEHCAHARFVWNLAVEQHRHWRPARPGASGYNERSRQLGPGSGAVVGVDRGVAVSAALSTGELLSVPGLREQEAKRLRRLQRRLARAARGSNRRTRVKAAIGRLKARETDRRTDWEEKVSTDLARRFDLIRVEYLKIRNMVRWGRLVRGVEDKAPGRVERIDPVFTSQTCHACGHCDAKNRESQALFRCRACGHADHADVNAAKNIAAGRAVTARGALQPLGGAVNREPQPVLTFV